MREQEKKWQRIYDLTDAETNLKFLCLPYTKQRNFFFFLQKKNFFKEKREWRIEQKKKRRLFNCSRYGD